MKRMKQWIAILSILTFLFTTACNSGKGNTEVSPSNTPEGSTSPSATKQELRPEDMKFELTVMDWFTDDIRADLIKETIKVFNEKYPNVKVVHSGQTNINQSYKLAFDSGAAPDLIYLDDLNQQMLEKGNHLMDITADVERMGWKEKFSSGSLDFNNARHPGQYFSIGFIDSPRALFINEDITKKAGIDAPAKTLDELNEQLAKIKAAGYTPWEASEIQVLWLYYSIVLNSVPMEDVNKWYYLEETTPAFKQAFTEAVAMVDDWLRKGYFRKEILTVKSSDVVPQFLRGETAFALQSSATGNRFLDASFPVGVSYFPGKDPNVPATLVSAIDGSWAIAAKIPEEKKQAALDFIDTFANPRVASMWLEKNYKTTIVFDRSGVELAPLLKTTFNVLEGTQTGYFLDNAVPGLVDMLIQLTQRLEVQDITPERFWEMMDEEYEKLKKEYK